MKSVKVENGEVKILNHNELLNEIDELIYKAVFDENKNYWCYIIRKVAKLCGIYPASIYEIYDAYTSGKTKKFTTPAFNLRFLTYDVARRIFRAAKKFNAGVFIFEIARSEQGYTNQTPIEFSTCVLAAAIKENWKGPVFIQGDHYQVPAKKYKENPDKELDALKKLIKESINAGFYNIDLDSSTLVDLSKPTLDEQQKENYKVAAHLTKYVRSLEPQNYTINLGGEIGEIGGENSKPEELIAYMEGYLREIPSNMIGIKKVAVQTGSSHGGIVDKTGKVISVKIDFDVLKNLGLIAITKYKMAGCVQHGASTLPFDLFDKFPENNTCEIHLATEFQNILYDSPEFPTELKNEMYEYCKKNFINEKSDKDTMEQFIYKTRKKLIGPFKKELWNMNKNAKEVILNRLEEKFAALIKMLNVENTMEYLKFVKEP
ncbi:MAG: class II fructose-bisphosphate aldolase, partial [bacterium]|nr:class II fructose-bisphosphate aldolase [bacterium]